MMEESVYNSVLLLDKCISSTIETINELEDIEYKSIVYSYKEKRINALLNQVYKDRDKKNYKEAIRKCIFLKKYVEREMRLIDGDR